MRRVCKTFLSQRVEVQRGILGRTQRNNKARTRASKNYSKRMKSASYRDPCATKIAHFSTESPSRPFPFAADSKRAVIS